ncbi:unnamed protein product [Lactuca virosa]|uniref:Alkyl transferase n=1 Tax=Lactuca virosa TaxID=75947 RepID=A0AAU9LT76_9ASTR|nr:unnamed protein product [Lactuca virosa]
MSKHVAVIIGGNRRWDRSRRLMPQVGYLTGARTLKVVVDMCRKWGIQVLTVFAFSSDNWLRPKVEVDFLMRLLENTLKDEVASMSSRDGWFLMAASHDPRVKDKGWWVFVVVFCGRRVD